MTASTERPSRRAPRRCGSPTSSSSGTPRAARRRCTRCCAATRRSSCRSSRSRGSSPPTARALPAAARARCPRRSRSTSRCSRRRGAGPARRRGLAVLPALARRRRGGSPRLQPGRADHRDPARARELPALVAPRSCPEPRRDREATCAGRSSSRSGAPAGDPRRSHGRRRCSTPTASRYVEQLRRYHDAVPAASRCWC